MLDALRQFVEWYLGVNSVTDSEVTRWRIQTADWVARSPTWTLWLVGSVVVLGVLFVYRRDARRVSFRRRWSLIALRLGTLGLLAVLLLQVTLSIDRVGLPLVGVLIDTSGSMRFQDDYSGTKDASAAASLEQPGQPTTRLELARNLLIDEQSELLAKLATRFRLRLFRFDVDSETIRSGEPSVESVRDAIAALEASGPQTALASSTRRVLEQLRPESPAAVVVLTDGISTEGEPEQLSSVVPFANRAAVPIYVVGVGSSKAARDIEITDVSVDEVAVVDQAMVFAGEIQASGFIGRDVVLELRDAKTGRRLAAKSVRLTEEQQSVELNHTPTSIGEFDMTFGVTPQAEEQIADNNYTTRHVSVRSGRIRVLLVDRLPRYEFRYIKHLLERDESVGVFELDTVLLDADPEWTETDRSASKLGGRIPISPKQINQYDVVILGDVDPSLLSSGGQSVWRDFVRENGGGLVFVAGPKFNPHAYRGSKLEPLVPLKLDRLTSSSYRQTIASGIKAEPTIPGTRSSRLFRFGENATATSRVVARFPLLRSMLEVDGVSAGASVLAAGTLGGEASELPLIISQPYGAGQVVFQATDDLWLWRFRSGDETHGRYWLNLVRYLARSSLLGRDRSAILTTNREIYDRGEPVEFRLRFRDTRKRPPEDIATVTLERNGGVSETVRLEASGSDINAYTGTLPAPQPGTWHAWVSAPDFEGPPPSADFRVQTARRELLVRDMDRASLIATTKATRGRFYTLRNANRLPAELPRGRAAVIERGQPIAIWSRAELMLLIVGLLALEWFLRKNARLV